MDKFRKKKFKSNPLEDAGLLSSLTYFYMFPIWKRTYKKGFTEDDLVEPLHEHKSCVKGEELEALWIKEHKKDQDNSLRRTLIKLFGLQFIFFGLLRLSSEIIMIVVTPFSTGRVIQFFEKGQTQVSEFEAWSHAFIIVLCRLFDFIVGHQTVIDLIHLTMQMKVACTSLIYQKCLKLHKSALSGFTVGQIINLISNDLSKFDQYFPTANLVWITPILITIGTYLLYQQIGVSAFYGVVILVSPTPVQVWFAKLNVRLRVRTVETTDQRIRLMNEIISGIQMIKMYCWENFFSKLILVVRRKELKTILMRLSFIGFLLNLSHFTTRLSIFVSILAEMLRGRPITAEKIFVVITIFSILRRSITNQFNIALTSTAEIYVSLKRIQKFLSLEEQIIDATATVHQESESKSSIFLKNVSGGWSESHILKNINFCITSNQHATVIGPVGSGKSSLFHVILKEMNLKSGSLDVNGEISYCSQEPWFFSGTIRDNIVFNSKFDAERYQRVVEICALISDFKRFPYGDNTLVGDKGRSLSGGQKARLNMARCLYKEADIYLLDDPLSAVDSRVGNHLYENCIKNFLKHKICILITHQLQYLTGTDRIVIMEDGKIVTEGQYNELQEKGVNFARLLANFRDKREIEDNMEVKSRPNSEYNEESPVVQEEMTKDDIRLSLYMSYFKRGGGFINMLCLFFVLICAQLLCSGVDYYVTYLIKVEATYTKRLNNTELIYTYRKNIMITYGAIILFLIIFYVGSGFYSMILSTLANKRLHCLCFSKIIRATMTFYNNNPPGRILNRFTKDLIVLDEYIPFIFYEMLQMLLNFAGILVLCVLVDYRQLFASIVLLLALYFFRIFFIRTGRDAKRVESLTRSPIYSHMATSVDGLITIRAFSAQEILTKIFDYYQDENTSALFIYSLALRCFGFWIDVICTTMFVAVIIVFFYFKEVNGANIGLVLTQYILLTGYLQWCMRQWTEFENELVSLERFYEYCNIKTETITKEVKQIPKNWPGEGRIVFRDVSLKYNPQEMYILKKLNFMIRPQEKIGIVGRTGTGKSSLINALFQLYPTEGNIIIDGADITKLPLEQVRSKISIIPQEPFLFSETMRKNLDPFDENSDDVLWNALEQVELKSVVFELPDGLHCKVFERGSNFSVGQRQLVCLARALVRNNNILVLDEATANVDPHTDDLIQKTMRKKFAHCTVLTIAHRLQTVMDSDRILVMNDGSIEEFDHPFNLLRNKGYFYKLVQSTGKITALNLQNDARENYERKMKHI